VANSRGRGRPGAGYTRGTVGLRPSRWVLLAGLPALAWNAGGALAGASETAGEPQRAVAFVRVDQVGYAPDEPKIATLLAEHGSRDTAFRIEDQAGQEVFQGLTGPNTGRWNARYRAVHPIDFSSLQTPGTYRIVVGTSPPATSPPFRIAVEPALFDPLVADAVTFFQAQRDGPDVIAGTLDRQPAHLNDATLQLYDWPTYEDRDSDVIVGDLVPLPGTTDLAGGWFDAGDFIKFTHTTAYADALLWASLRELGPSAPSALEAEARFGLDWLRKTWHPETGVMDLQVGVGSGNARGTILGDHDLWRLPQEDDAYPGDDAALIRSRPAFAANEPGTPLPPNLAGRAAAAFALAAQVDATTNRDVALAELELAATILGAAKTENVRPRDVVTALPHAFYPESSWRDDMELGAAELALAAIALGDVRAVGWLAESARYADGYEHQAVGGGDTEAGDDTFNLYDTSALAHADLVRALRLEGDAAADAAMGEPQLIEAIGAQLERAARRAESDPFGAGIHYDGFDAVPHAFGVAVTERLYRGLTGVTQFRAMATRQRDWALGANAWGTSFMIGAGSRFPLCPQHVVANLSGHLDGTDPILRGAVVNGPNSADLFADGLDEFFDGAPICPPTGTDRYARFSGHGSRFVDDVRAWQTVEPALDFTAVALFAFALSR
jgi:hypothetical protein